MRAGVEESFKEYERNVNGCNYCLLSKIYCSVENLFVCCFDFYNLPSFYFLHIILFCILLYGPFVCFFRAGCLPSPPSCFFLGPLVLDLTFLGLPSAEAFQYRGIGLHIDLACSNVDIIGGREFQGVG